MKRIISLSLFCMMILLSKAGINIPFTEIPYNVNYHWGIIDVNIAHGTVKYQCDGTHFEGTLDGVSIPWEGHVIVVSDTLNAIMAPGEKYSLESITYQSGWYRRPKAKYYRSNTYDASNPENYKNIAGHGEYNASSNSMEAIAITSDMIAMYYYVHEFDFASFTTNEQFTLPIQGQFEQKVVVTYLGEGSYEIEDVVYPTYNIMFEYNYKGKMSGYPVQMRVRKTDKLPIFLSASIPVGKVEMIYNP